MTYPKLPNFRQLSEDVELYAQLKSEYGAKGIASVLSEAEKALRGAVAKLRKLPDDRTLAKKEPSSLRAIQALRPTGPRRLWDGLDEAPRSKASHNEVSRNKASAKDRLASYKERLEGALIGRMAGCTLGAPVEFWSIARMKRLAEENKTAFPPTDYWTYVPYPAELRYDFSRRDSYTRGKLNGVPVDDDIAYTLLGLLIVEDFGPDFTIEDAGKAWLKYLPYACSAEDIALKNLKKGVPASQSGVRDNPYCEWIGADIRSDPWGYMAPGWPERAAEMAYRDAYISHRRQGIYGEMFFAAAISAAFAVNDPVEALRIGLTEIPRDCALARAVRWALRVAPEIKNYQQARDAMEAKFAGMHNVHTINNACLAIWGITIGGTDFTRAISETVAMGMDNDCTGATVGSIVGAVVGRKGIPAKWSRGFDDTVHSYLINRKKFSISGLLRRFEKQARLIHG